MPNQPAFTIGELSKRTGCNVETIRYYEKTGLLAPGGRTPGGYRLYDAGHARRLAFIRRCRELGFSLADVRSLLEIADDAGNHTRADVKALITGHRDELVRRIAGLQALLQALDDMSAQCDGAAASAADCPILDVLSAAPPARKRRAQPQRIHKQSRPSTSM